MLYPHSQKTNVYNIIKVKLTTFFNSTFNLLTFVLAPVNRNIQSFKFYQHLGLKAL